MLFRATKGKFNTPIKPTPFPFCYKQELPVVETALFLLPLYSRSLIMDQEWMDQVLHRGKTYGWSLLQRAEPCGKRQHNVGAHGEETMYNQQNGTMKACTTDLSFVLEEGGIHMEFWNPWAGSQYWGQAWGGLGGWSHSTTVVRRWDAMPFIFYLSCCHSCGK